AAASRSAPARTRTDRSAPASRGRAARSATPRREACTRSSDTTPPGAPADRPARGNPAARPTPRDGSGDRPPAATVSAPAGARGVARRGTRSPGGRRAAWDALPATRERDRARSAPVGEFAPTTPLPGPPRRTEFRRQEPLP